MLNDLITLTGLSDYPFCVAVITSVVVLLMVFLFYRLILNIFRQFGRL